MKTTFLGQGFESSSVDAIGNYLIEYLNQQDFHSFTGISAFASEAGFLNCQDIFKLQKMLLKPHPLLKELTNLAGQKNFGKNFKSDFTIV